MVLNMLKIKVTFNFKNAKWKKLVLAVKIRDVDITLTLSPWTTEWTTQMDNQ